MVDAALVHPSRPIIAAGGFAASLECRILYVKRWMRTCRPSRAAECAATECAQQQRPPLLGPYPMATFVSWRRIASLHSSRGCRLANTLIRRQKGKS